MCVMKSEHFRPVKKPNKQQNQTQTPNPYQSKSFKTGGDIPAISLHISTALLINWKIKIVYDARLAQACLFLTESLNPPRLSGIDSIIQRKSITWDNQIHCLHLSFLIHLI